MRGLAAIALALCFIVGCAKKDNPEPDPDPTGTGLPPPITEAEADRGRQACQAFADKVCDLAAGDPARTDDCDLAKSRPSAYDLNLRAAMAEGNTTAEDKAAIIDGARKIAKACFEDLAAVSGGRSISDSAGGNDAAAIMLAE